MQRRHAEGGRRWLAARPRHSTDIHTADVEQMILGPRLLVHHRLEAVELGGQAECHTEGVKDLVRRAQHDLVLERCRRGWHRGWKLFEAAPPTRATRGGSAHVCDALLIDS